MVLGRPLVAPPPTTALGGLIGHLTDKTKRDFQPSNVNFGLLPPIPQRMNKKDRPAFHVNRALGDLEAWRREAGL
jgi:methylenetetrahydrofolate--tRNA-(uracil-5-)-methyltransferase